VIVSVFHNTFSEVRGNRDNGLFPGWSLGSGWTFLPLLFCLGNAALWISSIFLFGRAEKASLILRIFEVDEVACAYDRGEGSFILLAKFLK